MKRFIQTITRSMLAIGLLAGLAGSAALLSPEYVSASNVSEVRDGVKAVGGDRAGNRGGDFTNLLENIINILLFIIGAIAVIMIIVGGIRYTTSNGDSNQINGAKNTILYAIVGLVIAIMAYAIVNFVLNSLN